MYHLTITVLCFIAYIHQALCIDYDGWLNIKIEHSLKCNESFCHRGNIALRSIRAGTSIIDQAPLSDMHMEELRQLAKIDGFYTMRAIVSSAENTKGTEFLSSVKAKTFLDNSLADAINAWVLPNGAVIAINFHVTNSSQPIHHDKDGYKMNTKFYLRYVDQAPVPDTASYIQKLEREREARERGEVKDNRSFLAKYWMYIVPVAIFVMISGATNPEPAGQVSR